MTVKIQCPCGAKYSFEVEPVEGRMPFAVNCPACNADGTELANEILAATAASKPRLHVSTDAPAAPAAIHAATQPVVRPPVRAMDRIAEERSRMRHIWGLVFAVAMVLLAALGALGWFTFSGSKPHLEYSTELRDANNCHSEFLEPGKILLISASRAVAHDLAANKDLWETTLPGGIETGAPITFLDKESIWVCLGTQVLRLDRATGAIKQTIPVSGELQSITPSETRLLVVSAKDETTRNVLQIDRASGETSSQQIVVPRSEKHAMPNELPPNVQPTAGVLLSQANEDHRFNKSLNAVSSEFFSSGANLVELRVTLVEPKVTWVQAIKPKGPSHLNGQTSSSSSASDVAEELFNDIKRSQTGGMKGIDESTYHVRLRRWTGTEPVEWQGDVSGVPMFFSLKTVDLLVAGKTLTVFDKQNNELFAAKLTYSLGEQFKPDNWDHRSVPAAEANSMLYFFDAAVLTAFSLPAGEVQWRMPSIGVSQVQSDGQGAIYVSTTTASPEDVQYSEQISMEHAASVLLKVNAPTGKILWQSVNTGQECSLSGKFLYAQSMFSGGAGILRGAAEAFNAPKPEGNNYLHIYRLDPSNGQVLWEYYRERRPDEISFCQNRFLLRFDSKVEALKFLSF